MTLSDDGAAGHGDVAGAAPGRGPDRRPDGAAGGRGGRRRAGARSPETLAGDLAALVEELPPGEKLRLDEFRFGQAREHPDRLGGRRRALRGLAGPLPAGRRGRGRGPVPAAAVGVAGAGGGRGAGRRGGGRRPRGAIPAARPPWWAAWYGGLGAGGRAMVEAEAVTWATQLWTALEWERLVQPMVGGPDDWWDCPGTRVADLEGPGRRPGAGRGAARPAGGRIGGPAGRVAGRARIPGPGGRPWPGGRRRSRPGWWGCGRPAGRCGSSPSTPGPWPRRPPPSSGAVATWVDARLEAQGGH